MSHDDDVNCAAAQSNGVQEPDWNNELPPICDRDRILVKLKFENIPGFEGKTLDRYLLKKDTVWDVVNLCHAVGLKEETFDVKWRDILRGNVRDMTMEYINERYGYGYVWFTLIPKE